MEKWLRFIFMVLRVTALAVLYIMAMMVIGAMWLVAIVLLVMAF